MKPSVNPVATVMGWTTHDSPIRLEYFGETSDLLRMDIPGSPYQKPRGGPARSVTIHLKDLRVALDALEAGSVRRDTVSR